MNISQLNMVDKSGSIPVSPFENSFNDIIVDYYICKPRVQASVSRNYNDWSTNSNSKFEIQ